MYHKRKQFECIRPTYFGIQQVHRVSSGLSAVLFVQHQRIPLIKPYGLQSLNQKIQITRNYTTVNKTMLLPERTENLHRDSALNTLHSQSLQWYSDGNAGNFSAVQTYLLLKERALQKN